MAPTDFETILNAAVDVTLILDEQGRIQEALPGRGPGLEEAEGWEGGRWSDLVTPETRPKVEALIEEGFSQGVSRFRQVNHLLKNGTDVPMGFTTVRLGGGKRLIAVGRSLKTLADLQRRLVEAQQTMESEYWQVRQAEARYRLLFQQSRQPVFLVDARTLEITDVNNAGAGLVGSESSKVVGRTFPLPAFRFGLNGKEDQAVQEFEEGVRQVASGATNSYRTRVRVRDSEFPWILTLNLVRFAQERILLARMETERGYDAGASSGVDIMELLDRAPDGFVVADLDGKILLANQAFVDMVQAAGPSAVEGRSIGLWFGRPGADLTVLLTQLERNGQIRHFHTSIQGEHGLDSEVEVSAVSAAHAEIPAMAIVLRDITRRLGNEAEPTADLNEAVERLTDRVGQVSLKQLVEDTVSLVELHFIDAALQLTGDNRSAAAELLGLSRQSLYTKLKRYGLDRPDTAHG
ncbi:MAG: transcriptional regulator PpsR [Gemmatimonadota bacterium]